MNQLKQQTNKQTTPLSSSFLDVNKIENLLTESEKILQFSTNNPPDLTIAIEKLVKRLPSPSQLERSWEKATSDQIRKSIELLYSVLSVYAMEILPREGRLLTEQNTAWALLATIHQLSSRLNKDLKYKYGIFFTPFKELINDWSFTNFRYEDLKLYQEIVSYFEKLPKESILFNIAKALEKIDESNQEKKNAFNDTTIR